MDFYIIIKTIGTHPIIECSKCASASSSGFSENSCLKLDQFICTCHCPAASWFCSCLWLGAAGPSSAIFLTYNFPILICHASALGIFLLIPVTHPRHDKLTALYLLLSKSNLSQMLEFDDSWKLVTTSLLQVLSQIKNLFLTFFSFFLVIGRFLLLEEFSTSDSSSF